MCGLAALEAIVTLLVFPSAGVYRSWPGTSPRSAFWHWPARCSRIAIAGCGRIAWLLCGWGVASLASYLVANPVGDNLARLRYAVFPLILLIAVRRQRSRVPALLAAAALAYAAAPDLIQVSVQADARSSHAQAWAPAITYLQRHLALGARVEAVPTSARWEAYYLPARGIPLARGWFRQTDLARNGILYARTLSGAAYRAWLGGTAVQYVLLTPPFPLDDHGATAEARLLRSRLSGLRVVWRRAGFTIYAAQHPARLMTGTVGARLTVFTHARIAGTVRRAGAATLKVRFSLFWKASGTARCVVRGRGGMSVVHFAGGGAFSLSITDDPITIARRVTDPDC